MSGLVRSYYNLAKPGLVYGNSLAFITGYLLGLTSQPFDLFNFSLTLIGVTLVMGASCVINNILDRDIDIEMSRTKNRAMATGLIKPINALSYSVILLLLGSAGLFYGSGILVMLLGLTGFLLYAFLYTKMKRITYHATLVGTIPGALPPVIGYLSSGASLHITSLLIFVTMISWQMVHFYAIALLRKSDYRKVGIPVAPLIIGEKKTILWMRFYGLIFFITMMLIGIYQSLAYSLVIAVAAFLLCYSTIIPARELKTWSKKVFRTSLIILLVWPLAVGIGLLIR